MSDGLNARVTQRVDVSPSLMILRVVPDGWDIPPFIPGQFAVLGLPGSAPRCPLSDAEEHPAEPHQLIKRAYSIASSSVAHEHLEFYIALVRSGHLTPRLFALDVGRRVYLGPQISGMFTFDHLPDEAHLVLAATGTGVAPYLSMLRSQLNLDAPRRIAVLLGARHSWDIGYRSELTALQRVWSKFSFLPTISHPDEEPFVWSGATGTIQDLWNGGALARAWGFRPGPDNSHVFLCGHPAMVDGMTRQLVSEGFRVDSPASPGQIHGERYW